MIIIGLILFALLTTSNSDAMATLQGKTFLSPRSQSVDAARELVGWYRFINLYDQDFFYGAVTATPQFGRTFRPERIAQYFFGTDQLVITGSQVPSRLPNQLLADYFGLSPMFQSTVCISPKIVTFLVDFDGYIGYKDFYFRAHAPAVWVKNSMDLCETVIDSGASTPFPALYMASEAVTAPATSWTQAMAGNLIWGQVTKGISVGRIISKSRSGLAEIQTALGWNFINRPNGHCGLNLRVYFPTGTKPDSEIFFESIVGNGHHWEVGFGFTGHIDLWEKDCHQKFAFYTDLNVTHLFANRQFRSFDLCSAGFFSRYMLAKQFDNTGTYTGQTISLIDATTLPCKVSAAIQMDWALMFAYMHGPWSFDLGYDAWLRTHENISLCEPFPFNTYGLKGIQNVATLTGLSNTTQSTATIFGNQFSQQVSVADSSSPLFISPSDININSAASSFAFTNKIFGLVSYIFDEFCYGEPFLGAGGEVEFEGLNPRETADLNHNSISQWAVWVKGGFGF